MTRRTFLTALAASPIVAAVGCSSSAIYHVSGIVTYNDKPLPYGTIFFNPAAGNHEAAQGTAFIKDGAFDTRGAGGRGVSSGDFIVNIKGLDGKFISTDEPNGKTLFNDFTQEVPIGKADLVLNFKVPVKKTAS